MGNTFADCAQNCYKPQSKSVSNSPRSPFADTLLTGRNEDNAVIAKLNEKYNNTRKEYDELFAKYSQLQDKYKSETEQLSLELTESKQTNTKEQNQHKCEYQPQLTEMEAKYAILQNKYDILSNKSMGSTEQLHTMYHNEYEKLLNDFIEYKQNHRDMEPEYNNIKHEHSTLVTLMNATQDENEKLMEQLTARRRIETEHKSMQIQYRQIQEKYNDAMIENEQYGTLKTQYELTLNQLDETNDEYQKLMDQLISYKQKQKQKESITMEECEDEKYNKLLEEMDTIKDESENMKQDITEYKLMHIQYKDMEIKCRRTEEECDEHKRRLNETVEKHSKLQHEYGVLYNELTEIKTNHKHRVEQLETMYQSEYENLLEEFNEFKQRSEVNGTEHLKKNIKTLTKQNTFMKQNQNEMEKIYEAEYEKLLKEFKEYKDSYP